MYKLIIIDDEEKIADGMSKLFPWSNIGFEVVASFTSARKALEFMQSNQVDVVLSDIEMPDINGVELSKTLMDNTQIKTVLFSSYDNFEYLRAAIHNKVVDYLIKPIEYSALLECFQRVKTELDERNNAQEEKPRSYYENIVFEVKAYLNEAYQDASLERAAERVNLSPTYLSKIYKEKSGVSFSDTLLNIRMEKACEMLSDIRFKSYDIAYYIGYDNPKNFSRAFKAYYHVSPSEYRKTKLGEENT